MGWNVKSWLWQVVVQSFKLRKTWTTPLHPPSGSMVEQCVKTVEEHLRKVVLTHQKDWDKRMHNFLLTYITQTHKNDSHHHDVQKRATSALRTCFCGSPDKEQSATQYVVELMD